MQVTPRAKAASSKDFCICRRLKNPKSPPRFAEEQSLNSFAKSLNFDFLSDASSICFLYPEKKKKKPCIFLRKYLR